MAEKKFEVFMIRTTDMVATIYAETEDEAREIAENSSDVDWEACDTNDDVTEIRPVEAE
jgi:hypothetical protein